MKTTRILTLTAIIPSSFVLGVARAERDEKAKDIVAVASGNGVIHVIDTVVLPN